MDVTIKRITIPPMIFIVKFLFFTISYMVNELRWLQFAANAYIITIVRNLITITSSFSVIIIFYLFILLFFQHKKRNCSNTKNPMHLVACPIRQTLPLAMMRTGTKTQQRLCCSTCRSEFYCTSESICKRGPVQQQSRVAAKKEFC